MRDLPMRPELLARFREGDPAALSEVYREYAPRLGKWLENRQPGLPSAADHADAVQEVFMRAVQRQARLAYLPKRMAALRWARSWRQCVTRASLG